MCAEVANFEMSNSFCLCLDKVSAHHYVCVWSIWKKYGFYTSNFVPFIKDDDLAHEIAKLFSSYLDSEEKREQCYLPMLRKIATAELEYFPMVAVFLVMMLLEKVSKKGTSKVAKLFQDKQDVRRLPISILLHIY